MKIILLSEYEGWYCQLDEAYNHYKGKKKKTQAMLVGDYLDWLIEVEQSIVNTVGTVHGLRS